MCFNAGTGVDAKMRMHIDNARRDPLARCINDVGAICAQPGSDPGDFAINDILLVENPACILNGMITFKTSVPAKAEILIEGAGKSWSKSRF